MKVCVCVHARESVCMCVRLCVHTSINEHQIYTQGTHTHLCSHGGMYAQVEHVSSHFEYTHVSGHTDNRTIWWNAHRWYAPSLQRTHMSGAQTPGALKLVVSCKQR